MYNMKETIVDDKNLNRLSSSDLDGNSNIKNTQNQMSSQNAIEHHDSNKSIYEDDKVEIVNSKGTFHLKIERPEVNSLKNTIISEEKLEYMFRNIATNNDGTITEVEIENILLKINRYYGREYTKEDAFEFFHALNNSYNESLSLNQFKKGFISIKESSDHY